MTHLILEKENNFPKEWSTTRLSNIAIINPHKPVKGIIPNNIETTFIPMRSVEALTGNINLSEIREYGQVSKGYTYFQNHDILFAKITPCMENGKIAIVKNLKNGIGFGSTEFHVIRIISNELSKEFYFWYLLQKEFRNNAHNNMKGTAGQLRVSTKYIQKVRVPLPPTSEQKRIVAKIESIFTKIDAAKERLETLALQTKSTSDSLSMLKSSILKQAFEGKLVPQDHDDEPAEILLKRLHKDSTKKLIFEKNNLPKGWIKTTIEDICTKPQYGWTTSAQKYGKIHLLRTTDITQSIINWDTVPYCKNEPKNVEKYLLHEGDIVISRAGSVGFSKLLNNPKKSIFASYLIRFNPFINKQFFAYFLQSSFYWTEISNKSVGIALANVNATKLKKINFLLPPIPEQKRIVAKIESIFDKIDVKQKKLAELEIQLKSIPDSIAALKDSILKLAFEGKLVPQDPNEESADILLKRIKFQNAKKI